MDRTRVPDTSGRLSFADRTDTPSLYGGVLSGVRSRIRWLAGRDGIAHGRRPNAPRTLCNAPAIPERMAWPEVTRCFDCIRIAALDRDTTHVVDAVVHGTGRVDDPPPARSSARRRPTPGRPDAAPGVDGPTKRGADGYLVGPTTAIRPEAVSGVSTRRGLAGGHSTDERTTP